MASFRNGPRAGRGTGRARNTLANNFSKTTPAPVVPNQFLKVRSGGATSIQGKGYPTQSARTPTRSGAGGGGAGVPAPPVSPGSAAAYGNQMAQLQLNLAAQLAQGRAQRGLLQGQFRMDKADIRANRIAGIGDVVSGAIGSGILGGSADVLARSGVDSEAATQLNAAIQRKVQGILGIKMDRINATNEYYTGVYGIQAAKAAERAQLANQAFLQDLVMRMGDEGAPPGSGGIGGSSYAGGAPGTSGAYGIPTDTSVGGNQGTLTPAQIAAIRRILSGGGLGQPRGGRKL